MWYVTIKLIYIAGNAFLLGVANIKNEFQKKKGFFLAFFGKYLITAIKLLLRFVFKATKTFHFIQSTINRLIFQKYMKVLYTKMGVNNV